MNLSSVLSCNTFRRGTGRCLCPAMAMVNHSCEANCRVQWEESGEKLVLKTRRKISPGEQLTITYVSSLLGTFTRQKKLKETKGFQCRCNRCLDPEEKGTYMSGIICSKCKKGWVVPHLKEDQEEMKWMCKCGFQANSDKVCLYK